MEKTVLAFISEFTNKGQWQEVITSFTCGNCYWFAWILQGRFFNSNVTIVYDEIANHFGCAIDNKVYDITGDVTNNYNWDNWSEVYLRDPLLGDRIIRDCVLKEKFNECAP